MADATATLPPTIDIAPAGRIDDDAVFRRSATLITLAFWLCSFGIAAARAVLDEYVQIERYLAMRGGVALIGCAICFGLHLVLRRLDARPFWQRALAVAILTLAAGDALTWLIHLGTRWANCSAPALFSASEAIYGVVHNMWFLMAWSALYLALRYSLQVKAQERRWRAVQALAHAAQLRALRNQISPHFLFNTLNSISALIMDGRSAAADEMVTRLSEFFRISLAVDPLDDIEVAEELRLQRHYLEIERARFPDLSVHFDVPEALTHALVPTLILQPIVENAVKYAIARSPTPASIRIAVGLTPGGRLHLAVADDGGGPSGPPGTGIGLANVRNRLASRFAADFAFRAGRRQPRGFAVDLELPLRFAA